MTSAGPLTAGTPAYSKYQRWLVALCAGSGLALGAMDTGVNVALPAITADFGTDMQTIQWIIVSHVAARAGLSVAAGSSGDLFGLKRVFLVGAALNTIALLAVGLTPDLYAIFGIRVLQGIGTGILLAASPAVAAQAYPAHQRSGVMGVAFSSQALGLLTATLGAAVLVEFLGWRWIFLARVPISAGVFLLGWLLLRRDDRRPEGKSLDVLGALALSGSLVALVIGLHVGGREGWAGPLPIAMLALAPVLLVLLWHVERTASWPAMDMALLKIRAFVAPCLAVLLGWTGIFVIWFIFPFYISDILERGAPTLGAMLATLAAAMSTAALAGGWMSDRIPPRHVAAAGLAVLAAGLAWMAYLGADSSVWMIAIRIGITGFGLGLTMATVYTLTLDGVPGMRTATAAGALGVAESMGRVISVAVFGSLFAIRMVHHETGLGILSSVGDVEIDAFVTAFREVFLMAAGLAAAGMVVLVAMLTLKLPVGIQSRHPAPDDRLL